jgi:hypothetical protein
MKYIATFLIWFVILVLAVIPTTYFFYRVGDPIFADSAIGNWFATMVGALAGIGIALELNRIGEMQRQSVQKQENDQRKKKILMLVKRELSYNLRLLSDRQPTANNSFERVIPAMRLKDEVWNAFSDGGELQWLQSPKLVETIATTYYCVRAVMYLEDLFQGKMLFTAKLSQVRALSELRRELEEADKLLERYLIYSIKEVENSLQR